MPKKLSQLVQGPTDIRGLCLPRITKLVESAEPVAEERWVASVVDEMAREGFFPQALVFVSEDGSSRQLFVADHVDPAELFAYLAKQEWVYEPNSRE